MKRVCWFLFITGLCHSVSKATECTTRGRFPNDDPECRGYTMCLYAGPSGFMQYNITCPVGFVYTHLEQQCTNSTTYKCQPSFICNVTGNFEDPLTSNCSSFVACVDGINGIVPARRIECPGDKIFDPQEGGCTNGTDFMCKIEIDDPMQDNITGFNVQAATDNGFQHTSSVNSAVSVDLTRVLFFTVMIVCLSYN